MKVTYKNAGGKERVTAVMTMDDAEKYVKILEVSGMNDIKIVED